MNGYEKRKTDRDIGLSYCKENRKFLGDNSKARFKKALLATGFALLCTGSAAAQDFTGTEFLAWSRDSQVSYLQTSIGMAGLIAGRNDSSQANCIDDWFFHDHIPACGEILETIAKNPTYHPRGVILALIEKKCGKLIYK